MLTQAEERAHAARAVERAKKVLHVGDRVSRISMMGTKGHITMIGWSGDLLRGSFSHCHPLDVYGVNGKPVSFRDPDKPHPRGKR